MILSCTSKRYTKRACSLAESVGSNSTAPRPSAYLMPASNAALNSSASCLGFFIVPAVWHFYTSRVHIGRPPAGRESIGRYLRLFIRSVGNAAGAVEIAEEVSRIPARALWILRDIAAAQEDEFRVVNRGIEVQPGLFHVVLRLVVAGFLPFFEDDRRIDFRVAGLEPGDRIYGGNGLLEGRERVAPGGGER